MLNSTFVITAAALTYLCIDPVAKAAYVLRCYYGQSRRTGEDLAAELEPARIQRRGGLMLGAFLSAMILFAATASGADSRAPDETGPVMTAPRLEAAVAKVLGRSEYQWRSPDATETAAARAPGFWDDLSRWLRKGTEAVMDWVEKGVAWLRDLFRKLLPRQEPGPKGTRGWSGSGYALLYLLLAAGMSASVLFILRLLGRRRARKGESGVEMPAPVALRLEEEGVKADALPEDEWVAIARGLLGRGETRLALRALYLAALAHLAGAGLVSLADYKSDGEYEEELVSRGPGVRETASSFCHVRRVFEAAWYGMHSISPQGLEAFMDSHRRVMGHAES